MVYISEYMVLVYIAHIISYLFPYYSGAFLMSIYKGNFHKGIGGVISPYKSHNFLCWNSYLIYLD